MIGPIKLLHDKIWQGLVNWLVSVPRSHHVTPNDFEVIREKIRPGDVLLVEGRTRVGGIIKNITRSAWSHSALCIGSLNEIEELATRQRVCEHYQGSAFEPLLIEAEIDRGTTVTPLSNYSDLHVRIARPIGLSEEDAEKIVRFMASHLGHSYDVKQLLDLARFLLPWWALVPRRWHSSLFEQNAGEATRNVCSSLVAKAFQHVGFPVLPLIEKDSEGDMRFYVRNHKLFTPRDFDYSPFFKILKYPLLSETPHGFYRAIRWQDTKNVDQQRVNYMNAEDVVFVSGLDDGESQSSN